MCLPLTGPYIYPNSIYLPDKSVSLVNSGQCSTFTTCPCVFLTLTHTTLCHLHYYTCSLTHLGQVLLLSLTISECHLCMTHSSPHTHLSSRLTRYNRLMIHVYPHLYIQRSAKGQVLHPTCVSKYYIYSRCQSCSVFTPNVLEVPHCVQFTEHLILTC